MNVEHFRAFNTVYKYEKTVRTMFSPEYLNDSGSPWGAYEMWRESMQNIIDEAEYQKDNYGGEIWDHYRVFFTRNKPNSHWGSDFFTMQDFGRGVDIERVLLVGESGKRGSGYRGEKGEGENNSFLVAARMGLKKTMFSQDWAIEAEFQPFTENENYLVLVYHVYRSRKTLNGTAIRYAYNADVEYYFANRDNYFQGISPSGSRKKEAARRRAYARQDREQRQREAAEKRERKAKSTSSNKLVQMPRKGQDARLFVRGVYVRDISALFSYNIQDAKINRDRSYIEESSMYKGIADAFASSDFTKKMAEMYWENAQLLSDSAMEYHRTIDPAGNRDMMKVAFHKVFGKKACLATDTFMQTEAIALGFKPIDLDHTAHQTALLCNVQTDHDTSGFLNGYKEVKPTKKEQELLWSLEGLAKAMGFREVPVVIASKIANVDPTVMGICVDSYTKVVLMRKIFSNKRELVETFIHEMVHVQTRAGDGTRAFAQGFESIIMDLLVEGNDEAVRIVRRIVNG